MMWLIREQIKEADTLLCARALFSHNIFGAVPRRALENASRIILRSLLEGSLVSQAEGAHAKNMLQTQAIFHIFIHFSFHILPKLQAGNLATFFFSLRELSVVGQVNDLLGAIPETFLWAK